MSIDISVLAVNPTYVVFDIKRLLTGSLTTAIILFHCLELRVFLFSLRSNDVRVKSGFFEGNSRYEYKIRHNIDTKDKVRNIFLG